MGVRAVETMTASAMGSLLAIGVAARPSCLTPPAGARSGPVRSVVAASRALPARPLRARLAASPAAARRATASSSPTARAVTPPRRSSSPWPPPSRTRAGRCCAAICPSGRSAQRGRPIAPHADRDRAGLRNAVAVLRAASCPAASCWAVIPTAAGRPPCSRRRHPGLADALLLLSYPLHPPERPRRAAHRALPRAHHAGGLRARHARRLRDGRRARGGDPRHPRRHRARRRRWRARVTTSPVGGAGKRGRRARRAPPPSPPCARCSPPRPRAHDRRARRIASSPATTPRALHRPPPRCGRSGAARASPRSDRLFGDGVDAMESRDFSRAEDLFAQIIEIAPDFAEGWNKRATVRYLSRRLRGRHRGLRGDDPAQAAALRGAVGPGALPRGPRPDARGRRAVPPLPRGVPAPHRRAPEPRRHPGRGGAEERPSEEAERLREQLVGAQARLERRG